MSFYFLLNNLAFAFGMVGTIAFLMASWLSFDAYRIRPDNGVLIRSIGLALCAIWQLIHAMVLGSDILSYLGSIVFIVGLMCIASSFLRKSELAVHAVIVIPAFTLWGGYFQAVAGLLAVAVAYLSYRKWKQEQNRTWLPFSWSFLLVSVIALLSIFSGDVSRPGMISIIRLALELAAFLILGYWVWQYMQLRIRESIVMASVGATFLLATVVTLAFSTILISRVTSETAQNLIVNTKVLNLAITSLEAEALAKAELIAQDAGIIAAISKEDFGTLDVIAEKLLEERELGFLTIAAKNGDIMLRAHAVSRRGDTAASERAFEEALVGIPSVTVEDSVVEGFSIRAGAPVEKGGKIIGVVIAGYPLDNAFADRMKRVTGLEMFIYKGATSVAGTAFASDGMTRLVGVTIGDVSVKESVLEDGKTVTGEMAAYDELFQASYAPLENGDGKAVGIISSAKRQDDIVNIANATNRLTLVTVIGIILILLAPIYSISRRFSPDA
ncbi:MAG: cache domain-containing protein [Candidatus Paceibacterota bacterium]|jgi:hypothetical protein